jgi:hypothetical protein
MAKRLWGPFSIPEEREAGAERRGSGLRWFLMGKMATRDVRGERGVAIYHGLFYSVKSWTVAADCKLSVPFRCPERRIGTNRYICLFLDQLKI